MAEYSAKSLKVPSRSNSTISIDKRHFNEVNESDQGTLDDVSDQSFDDEVSEFDDVMKERRVSFKVGANTADFEFFFTYLSFLFYTAHTFNFSSSSSKIFFHFLHATYFLYP